MNKILFDFFPLLLFFVALKIWDIFVATEVAIAASVLQIVYLLVSRKKITVSHWLNLSIIIIFGGLTIYFHNATFIKWKPTVIYGLFAAIISGSLWFSGVNVLRKLMGEQIALPTPLWNKLAHAWSIFFVVMGALNLFVAFSGYFTEDQWATFKVFGMTLMLFAFVIGQSLFLSKHLKDQVDQADTADQASPTVRPSLEVQSQNKQDSAPH
ncbi:septation protein A [Brackiella oedipodis]|uniref:septation protein A n=1 Tax=Brackiella oedipodis TaxID=124225 RepID=UPI0009FF0B6F|nr:septation protein A [Brackiella oedipodis]